MSKSTGNLQFSPTYRALPKNIIELEKKGLGWELSGARQPSTLSLCATIITKTILYGSRDVGGRLEVKLSSGFASSGARNLANMGRGLSPRPLNHHSLVAVAVSFHSALTLTEC